MFALPKPKKLLEEEEEEVVEERPPSENGEVVGVKEEEGVVEAVPLVEVPPAPPPPPPTTTTPALPPVGRALGVGGEEGERECVGVAVREFPPPTLAVAQALGEEEAVGTGGVAVGEGLLVAVVVGEVE